MKILVSGHTGFVGSHLSFKHGIIGLKDPSGNRVDINDKNQLKEALSFLNFDFVIHLAAQSSQPKSFDDPSGTFQTNFFGTLNLLESLKDLHFKGRFLYVGSADCYGFVDDTNLPIDERLVLTPQNPYSASKLAAEALCLDLSKNSLFDIIVARPFNHIGIRQSSSFSISNFAKQVVEISLGIKKPLIEVGNIKVSRDFLDVQDVVEAYLLLLQKGKNGQAYNVCSGVERTLESVLDDLMRLKNVKAEIGVISQRLRKADEPRFVGSFHKLNTHTGWSPKIPFERSLLSIIEDWESKLLCLSHAVIK
jgi:GDP-4-dehydro-6-deoxy-D-mannose reductase